MLRAALSSKAGARLATSVAARTKFTLPELPYQYSELEPVISGQIMELHHSKHHNTYVTNLNAAMEKLAAAEAAGDVAGVIGAQGAIKFNGGGHINHSIFWQNLAPPSKGGGAPPTGALGAAIDAEFGGLEAMQTKLTAMTVAVQGSGWGWSVLTEDALLLSRGGE